MPSDPADPRLANVAGIHRHASVDNVPEDLLERIFRVNVYGTIYTNGAAYRAMEPGGGGALINFGSESGLTAEPNNSTYGATKGAVHTWTRSVARDWGPKGIRVNAVLPYIATPMYEEFRKQLSPRSWPPTTRRRLSRSRSAASLATR